MKKISKSFSYAMQGLRYAVVHEQNFKIEALCAIVVLCCSYFFKITGTEWMLVIINIALVLSAELVNSAIEKTCDFCHPENHPIIKIIKDISAAAVVVTALCAFVCAMFIFIPHFKNLML